MELSKAFRPEEIAFAKHATPEAPSYAKENENEIMHWGIGCSIVRLKKHKLSGACRIKSFQYNGGPERTKKGSPEHFAGKVGANLLETF